MDMIAVDIIAQTAVQRWIKNKMIFLFIFLLMINVFIVGFILGVDFGRKVD